ncbi:MAG TPA: MBL fold metallo-hydrolase [Mycobacteriales bacterium]|nr:MBL fold metallo-hydrolase [Mycobacteriales bacterium]
MRLRIVGCSGSIPGPQGPASCYLVEHEDSRLLLDLGNGAFGPLQRYTDPLAIDAVILSHLHADHCLDMSPYTVYRRVRKAAEPVPVLAPPHAAHRLAVAHDLSAAPLTDVFSFTDLSERSWEIGPFTIAAARVNHPLETYAIRVEAGGRAITYSADTGRSDALVRLAQGSDLLLCEATFTSDVDAPPNLHLTGAEAAEHARRAGVDRLVLTHLLPWTDSRAVLGEACESFRGLTEVAAPGATYDV